MLRNPTRSASLSDYESLALSVGLDPLRMLRLAKLPVRALHDPNLTIDATSVVWLLEESAHVSGQEAFGLLLADRRNLANFGMLALMLRQEPTLRAAMQSMVRYMRLHNAGVQLRLEDSGELVLLHLRIDVHRSGYWRQAIEQSTGIGLRVFSILSGNTFRPVSVQFAHAPPARLDVHHRLLGAAIAFSQECNAIVCRSRDLDVPLPAADPALKREVKRWLDLQLAGCADQPVQRTRQIVQMLLPTGLCSVDRIAEHLGMHRRTLNRRLALDGESATTIVDTVRAELAEEYLASSRRKLYEVAELLGFSCAGDFSRWFRTRFGVTPSDWVARHRLARAQRKRD